MSKALEIAKYLVNPDCPVTYTKCLDAAAELRNQDAEIKRLNALNKLELLDWKYIESELAKLRELNAELVATLIYYKNNVTGAEPSQSVFDRMVDEALAKAKE